MITAQKLVSFLIITIVLSGCGNKDSDPSAVMMPPVTPAVTTLPAEVLIFKNGFEGTTVVSPKPTSSQHFIISGSDGTAKSDWNNDLILNPYINSGQIYAETGTEAQRKPDIVLDPETAQPNNHVLRFRITEKHILVAGTGEEKTRIQYEMNNQKVAPAGGYMKEYYQKCRLYFSSNFKVLEEAPTSDIGWFVMQEFRNDPPFNSPQADGSIKPYSEQRNEVELHKINGKLYMGANGRFPIQQYPPEWEAFPTAFPIPFGKWMTQEIYIKEGGSTTGRFYLALTVDGVKHVLVDKTGITTSIAPSYVPDGQTSWAPMKIYTEGKVVDWFKAKRLPMDVYWDDLEIWMNKRP